jgi:ABC-type spermidine/putrescine transport system permease subunit II
MQDLMSTMVLICAALASLVLGVTLAFAVCRAGFALLRLQSPRSESLAAPAKTQTIEA